MHGRGLAKNALENMRLKEKNIYISLSLMKRLKIGWRSMLNQRHPNEQLIIAGYLKTGVYCVYQGHSWEDIYFAFLREEQPTKISIHSAMTPPSRYKEFGDLLLTMPNVTIFSMHVFRGDHTNFTQVLYACVCQWKNLISFDYSPEHSMISNHYEPFFRELSTRRGLYLIFGTYHKESIAHVTRMLLENRIESLTLMHTPPGSFYMKLLTSIFEAIRISTRLCSLNVNGFDVDETSYVTRAIRDSSSIFKCNTKTVAVHCSRNIRARHECKKMAIFTALLFRKVTGRDVAGLIGQMVWETRGQRIWLKRVPTKTDIYL
jgi:hypothetical protein